MKSTFLTKTPLALVSLCGAAGLAFCASVYPVCVHATEEPAHPAALDDAIIAAAKRHGVPEHLVRRIIMRESKYNPKARNHSFWGLMQISYPTAKSMGFRGTREELLNPVVNLRYAVPYLANAFVIAGKQEDAAVRLYAAGYYFTARSKGLLNELRTADSTPLSGVPDETPILAANAVVQPPQNFGIFGALFGPGQTPAPQPTQVAAYVADTSQQPGQASSQSQPDPQAQQASQQTSATAPSGTFDGAAVAMVVTKTGDVAPPKKWTRDGGMTLMARGEQGLDQVADRSQANTDHANTDHANTDRAGDDDTPRKSTRRHPAKITILADLDLPPSSAQAYAGTAGQDPRFAAADSQTAIAQATAGQPNAPQIDAEGQPIVSQPASIVAQDTSEKPVKRGRSRQARRHKPATERTQQALAEKPADAPAPPTVAQ